MKVLLCCASIIVFRVVGFCQEVNPPIDPRTNMEGFPTSSLAFPPASLKYFSEKQAKLWRARETGNTKSAKAVLAENAIVTSFTSAKDGRHLISQVETGVCSLKSFKLEDFVLNSSNPTARVLTYRAIQDATCNGKPLPQMIQVKDGYLNVEGRWTISFYLEELPNPSNGGAHPSH